MQKSRPVFQGYTIQQRDLKKAYKAGYGDGTLTFIAIAARDQNKAAKELKQASVGRMTPRYW